MQGKVKNIHTLQEIYNLSIEPVHKSILTLPLVNNYMHSENSTTYIIVMILYVYTMYTYLTRELKYALTVIWGF